MRRDGEALRAIEDPYAAHAAGRPPADLETAGEVTGDVLAPSEPQVVVGIAQNGPDHPSPVQAWLKSPRTVVASGTAVTLRRDAGTPVAEGEIAVVIARGTAGLTVQNAGDYVLGVSAVDDLSSPDRVLADPRNFESKSGVGHTPLEPWIDTEASLADVRLRMRVAVLRRARFGDDREHRIGPVGARTADDRAVFGIQGGHRGTHARHGRRPRAPRHPGQHPLPGYFATEMNRDLVDDDAFTAWLETRTPAGRWGDFSELDGPFLFLASDASSFVSGQNLVVDGGMTSVV